MRAFTNSERPAFRRDASIPTTASSNQPVETLRLCHLCDAIPANTLSLELGYDHYSSIKLLRASAGSEEYCHLCQMMWEFIATKQRFNMEGDPMLSEGWLIRLYAVQASGTEWSWRGYTAIEFRSGDRTSSQDCVCQQRLPGHRLEWEALHIPSSVVSTFNEATVQFSDLH